MYVAFDIIYRFLRYLGFDVNYVRNFTDIDDKIINRANERKEDPLALSRRFIDEYHKVRCSRYSFSFLVWRCCSKQSTTCRLCLPSCKDGPQGCTSFCSQTCTQLNP